MPQDILEAADQGDEFRNDAARRPLRVAVSGCGRLLEHGYLPAIARMPAIQLVGVADPHRGRRNRIADLAADQTGRRPRAFASDGLLLDALRIDAMVIASPAAGHVASATAAAKAAVPVLVEKPPAEDLDGARRLAELPSPVWLGFNRRFGPGRDLVSQIPADGFLHVDLELRYRRSSWRAYTVCDEALLDLGPHMIDLGLMLTRSEPIAVAAPRIEPDRVELVMQTTRAAVRIHGFADRAHRESITVRNGALRRIAMARAGGLGGHLQRLTRHPHPLVASLIRQLDQLRAAVRGEPTSGLASAACGVPVMVAIEAARESGRRGGVVVPLHGEALGWRSSHPGSAQDDVRHAVAA